MMDDGQDLEAGGLKTDLYDLSEGEIYMKKVVSLVAFDKLFMYIYFHLCLISSKHLYWAFSLFRDFGREIQLGW